MPTRTFPSFETMFAANLHSDLRGMVLDTAIGLRYPVGDERH
jgi:hypothetical protein